MWTSRLRRAWMAKLPPDKLLPDRQPAYVASWIYVFGVLTLAAFLVILLSGLVLAFAGPAWYHTSSVGMFTNSMHFWSVQLFFIFMVIHLWGKFWMAAWRGRRALTWITGVVVFLASHRHRLHRLPGADQLRLAVDLLRGQGRAERRRHRRLLQRREPRPDAAAPRLPAAPGGGGRSWCGTCCWFAGAASCRR